MSTPNNGKGRAIPSPRPTDDSSSPIRSPSRGFVDSPFGHASPTLPNIPPRIGSPSNENMSLYSSSQQQRHDSSAFPSSFQRTISIEPPSRDSASLAPPPADSGISTPSNIENLDALPISDERKARIIERHLARPDANRDSLSATSIQSNDNTDDSVASNDARSAHVNFPGSGDVTAESPSEIVLEDVEESYRGPHQMQGGAITDDVYRWAHKNRRVSTRRTRSESLHMPRTATIDPELDVQGIKEPGGFRRFFVINQAEQQGRAPPRALRSFIDFLSLYGHFAGEFLEEDDDDDEGDEDETDEEDDDDARAIPGTSRAAGNGDTERSGLLRGRKGLKRSDTRTRMRKASKERRRGEATVTDAVMMLLKSFVGTGVLFLGKAFYNGGLLFSTITLCSVAIISLVSFLLLVKTNLNCPGSFGDMGGILYGPRMRLAILASIVLSQLGFVAAYTVFVAQNMQAFVLAVTQCKTLVPIWALILGQMAVFLPLSLIRRIAKLSTTALIADVFILFGIVYLFQYEIGKVAKEGLADVVMFNSKDFPLFIGTAVFTFEGIGLVIPITESMKEPEKFPRALTGVMAFVMVLFASAGALSYMAFGSAIQTVVITNLPQTSRFVQAMQFLYSIAILLSTPLQLFPALAVLEKGIFTKSGKYNWKVKTEKNLFRFLVVAVCCLAAWAGANDLDKFVSLIGSVACVPLCFIYPPLLHLKANATRTATKVLNYAMLFFGIVCVVFAGSQTIRAMVESSAPASPPRCSPR
ncbi:vacuolar amino acid transporter 3 [Moesziomyces antarcticus]|uniref:Related to AVT3 - Vacuolar transporter, involved in amino acid efflux from the vacuole n=2 Tax=Pseudozyma antarctica TaxID=84753 RepID=A0A5C3FM45_PSEA2|nr:vacuolar amino acid transporter 3 [Moesziomyces antarcticus]GAK65805.1 vacuolar amino acid transporter 3 [Moesziomyces antarcticus]SPO45432.1 related to AVT3 - Vacuolar transporter, involved in amino acid efflux from the vacuole [Moesziomyces antarcticus]